MKNVSVEYITKFFGEIQVLSDVSFVAQEGQFVTIVGPSGCGKTTLLRIIDGLENPDYGQVRIGERIVSGPAKECASPKHAFSFFQSLLVTHGVIALSSTVRR